MRRSYKRYFGSDKQTAGIDYGNQYFNRQAHKMEVEFFPLGTSCFFHIVKKIKKISK